MSPNPVNTLPTFASPLHQHRAEYLLQPVLIRVIDNLRKQMEGSSWNGTYEENFLWPAGTTEEENWLPDTSASNGGNT